MPKNMMFFSGKKLEFIVIMEIKIHLVTVMMDNLNI